MPATLYASLPWLSDRPTIEELLCRPEWQEHAACRGVGHETFFVFPADSTDAATALCDVCPVRAECSSYADETGSSGIWAGREHKPRTDVIFSSGRADRYRTKLLPELLPDG